MKLKPGNRLEMKHQENTVSGSKTVYRLYTVTAVYRNIIHFTYQDKQGNTYNASLTPWEVETLRKRNKTKGGENEDRTENKTRKHV